MGEIKFKLDDKTEMEFREATMHEFGFRKGSLSRAAEQAISKWSKTHKEIDRLKKEAKEKIKDPIKAISGILKHVKKTSVELQHEASKIRSERWEKHVSN